MGLLINFLQVLDVLLSLSFGVIVYFEGSLRPQEVWIRIMMVVSWYLLSIQSHSNQFLHVHGLLNYAFHILTESPWLNVLLVRIKKLGGGIVEFINVFLASGYIVVIQERISTCWCRFLWLEKLSFCVFIWIFSIIKTLCLRLWSLVHPSLSLWQHSSALRLRFNYSRHFWSGTLRHFVLLRRICHEPCWISWALSDVF